MNDSAHFAVVETPMIDTTRLKCLRIALVLVGIIFIFGIYILMIVWPSGWAWHSGHSDYPLMIVGIYATLGVFLIRAAREPFPPYCFSTIAVAFFHLVRQNCL
jgi:hypothetical protein